MIGSISGCANRKKAGKGVDKLTAWAMEVIDMTHVRRLGSVKEIMMLATYLVQNGEYHWEINDQKFFNETESLMIDLVSGNPMSIRADEIYQAREEVIKALQTFLFLQCG